MHLPDYLPNIDYQADWIQVLDQSGDYSQGSVATFPSLQLRTNIRGPDQVYFSNTFDKL